MAGLLLLSLFTGALIVGLVSAIIYGVIYRKSLRRKWPMLVALPFGCMAAPIVGLLFLVGISALLQESDRALYEEIFGHQTTMAEDDLLTDDFGWLHNDREIYMRAEVSPQHRKQILAIPKLKASDLTRDHVMIAASEHQFLWWIETDGRMAYNQCPNAKVHEAPGFNEWNMLLITECYGQSDDGFMPSDRTPFIYIIAKR